MHRMIQQPWSDLLSKDVNMYHDRMCMLLEVVARLGHAQIQLWFSDVILERLFLEEQPLLYDFGKLTNMFSFARFAIKLWLSEAIGEMPFVRQKTASSV